ncbi:hypothetical protein PoB_000263600 [Plakobranchus ocellatus]|uniref:Uncharacterized protein n=1 Tax=Plakobranchus ocellatus TaxID=259542 RepID=A0AAV3XBL9_9GAST|nr:hypothetical protein PoB_000263600 [Plakobranchus ocellatus]
MLTQSLSCGIFRPPFLFVRSREEVIIAIVINAIISSSYNDMRGPLAAIQKPVDDKVISGFQASRQARVPVEGLEPATEGPLHIAGWIRYYRVTNNFACRYRVISGFQTPFRSGWRWWDSNPLKKSPCRYQSRWSQAFRPLLGRGHGRLGGHGSLRISGRASLRLRHRSLPLADREAPRRRKE